MEMIEKVEQGIGSGEAAVEQAVKASEAEVAEAQAAEQGLVAELEKKVEGALHKAEEKIESVEHQVEDAVRRIQKRLLQKVERITAVAEERAVSTQQSAFSRRTVPSFLAKVMAEAESGADGKQIDKMLSGLTVEQRVAVKMQMVKAGMI